MKEKFIDFFNAHKLECFSIVLIIMLIFGNTVARADSSLVEVGEDFPSLKDSVVEDYLSSDDDYILYYFYNEFRFVLFEGGGVDNAFINYDYDLYVKGNSLTYINFHYDGKEWVKSSSSTVDSFWSSFNNQDFLNTFSAFYSSFDVLDYTESSSSEQIFFQQTPLPMNLSPGFAVAQMTVQQIVEVMMKQIIGLLPLVIGLVVLVVALKKGLTMLYQRFKRA